MDYTTIGGIVLAMILVAGGGIYGEDVYVYLAETGNRDVCTDGGIWELQSSGKYYCPTEDHDEWCYRVSDSGRTCYIGEVVVPEETRPPLTEEIFANNKDWECEGTEPYSRCYSGNKEGYYGELV